jgi:hypothetical protein
MNKDQIVVKNHIPYPHATRVDPVIGKEFEEKNIKTADFAKKLT